MAIHVSKRPRLSSSITLSPFQASCRWVQNNMLTLVFAFVACIICLGLVYVGCGLWLFLCVNIAQTYEEGEVTAAQVWQMPMTEGVKIIGCILSVIYVINNARRK